MPAYGVNSYVMACKSDTIAPFNIDAAWAASKVIQAQNMTFAFTGGQRFTTMDSTTVVSRFPRGRSFWIDSIRISVPNLNGIVASNTNIGSAGNGTYNLILQNGIDVPNTFIGGNIAYLNDWMPVSRLVPDLPMSAAGIYIEPSSLVIQADFRNLDTNVFDGLSIYAYLEIRVNAAVKPTV